jgi:predicted RND superfamily exporter protein
VTPPSTEPPERGSANQFAHALALWPVRRPKTIVFLCVLLALAAAVGLFRLDFSTDYRIFFDPAGERRTSLDQLERDFGHGESLTLVLVPSKGDAFADRSVTALRWLIPRLARIKGVTAARSLLTYPVPTVIDGKTALRPLVPFLGFRSDTARAAAKARALADPLVAGRLVSQDGKAVGVHIQVRVAAADAAAMSRLLADLRAAVAEFGVRYPDITTGLTGIAAVNEAFQAATIADLKLFIPLSVGILLIVLAMLLRGVRGVAFTLAVVALASAASMGLAGWFGVQLTPPTAIAPIVIMAIGIANCVHILVGYFSRRRAGRPPRAAVAGALADNLAPIFLTSVTTCAGLLGLTFSDAPPFRELGAMAAAGVALALLFSVTVLPALMVLFPPRTPPVMGEKAPWAARVAAIATRRPVATILLTFAVTGGAAAMIPTLSVGDVYFRYLDKDAPARKGTEFVIANLTGACTLHFVARPDSGGTAFETRTLAAVDRLAARFRAMPGVETVLAPTDLLRRLDAADRRLAWNKGVVPEGKRAAELFEAYVKKLPAGDRRTGLVSADRERLHVIVSADLDSAALTRMVDAIGPAPAPGLTVTPSGPCYLFATIAEVNIRSMLLGTGFAFFMVSLCLFLALRSARLGLISLVPNILPPVLAFGLWAVLVGRVGVAASVIAATALGLIVDATIHLLTRYQRARRGGARPEAAIASAYGGAGTAVWMCGLVVTGAFAVLILSGFQVNRDLGLLTAITLTSALATDFLLLPALLILLDRKR